METKGLESLIPKKNFLDGISSKDSLLYLPIKEINPNPYQPRKTFSQNSLSSLAQSIKNYGILEPLIVAKKERKTSQGLVVEYQLIAGERRLSAAKMIGLKKVPVIVKKLGDKEELELSLIENIQREDLNPIEKAEAFHQLMIKFHLSLGEIAKISGKSKGAVSNSLRLLNLPQEIKNGLKDKKITEGHAKIIAALKGKKQKVVYQNILQKGLSVRETEKLVREYKQKIPPKKHSFSLSKDIKDALNIIKKKFFLKGIRVSLQREGLKITFVFPSLKQLKKVINRLLT